jgi:hypothetical protein
MFRFLSTRWHFGGTQTAESDLRTISMSYQKWKARGPWRRNEVTLLAPANHQSGRCEDARRTRPRRRCARRPLRLISHCKHAVGTQTTLPQHPSPLPLLPPSPLPALPTTKAVGARLRGGQAMALCTGPFTVSFAVQMQFNTHCEPDTTVAPLRCVVYELVRPQPPTASTAAQGCRVIYALYCRRCVRRAASWHRGSDSVSPPSIGRARIPPEPSISKSGPGDPEFEDPMVVFKIERAKCQVGVPCQASMTKGS